LSFYSLSERAGGVFFFFSSPFFLIFPSHSSSRIDVSFPFQSCCLPSSLSATRHAPVSPLLPITHASTVEFFLTLPSQIHHGFVLMRPWKRFLFCSLLFYALFLCPSSQSARTWRTPPSSNSRYFVPRSIVFLLNRPTFIRFRLLRSPSPIWFFVSLERPVMGLFFPNICSSKVSFRLPPPTGFLFSLRASFLASGMLSSLFSTPHAFFLSGRFMQRPSFLSSPWYWVSGFRPFFFPRVRDLPSALN